MTMSDAGMAKIAKHRQAQPTYELQRKWNKAKGRHSNAFWCVERIDLAYAEGAELLKKMKLLPEVKDDE